MKSKKIKMKIIEKETNQTEISKKINVSKQTINNWCNNRNLDKINAFLKMMKLLDLEVKDLIE